MKTLFAPLAAASLCCSSASAQALNINFAGILGPSPTNSYGAASGQSGFWNPVGNDDPLFGLDGSPTPARFAASGGGAINDIPGAAGDDAALMETVFTMPKSGNGLSVYNLEPGFYDLYLYMWGAHFQGEDRNTYRFFNGVDTFTGGVSFGRDWPGGQVQGVTYTFLRIHVLPEFRGFNLSYESLNADAAYVNGLQLVPVPGPSAGAAALALVGMAAAQRRRR